MNTIPKADKVKILGHVTIRHYNDLGFVRTLKADHCACNVEGDEIGYFTSIKEAFEALIKEKTKQ